MRACVSVLSSQLPKSKIRHKLRDRVVPPFVEEEEEKQKKNLGNSPVVRKIHELSGIFLVSSSL